MPLKKLKIGVSACLLGMKYRYDGTSKLDQRIVDRLLGKVDFVPVCPEVECGLEIPRPAMRLERTPGGTRLRVIATGGDETRRMEEWAGIKIEQLLRRGIGAFLFKARSPSCGVRNTSIFDSQGRCILKDADGIFVRMLRLKCPKMVIGSEDRLEEFVAKLNLDIFRD